MNMGRLPLSLFTVICDGSACGSGPVGEHTHPRQDGGTPLGTVRVTNGMTSRVERRGAGV